MSDKYVKTSAEELTAMANGLREVGDFAEGQKFVFPSSEYDENSTTTYWIYSNNNWVEKTAQQAAALTGYTEIEVSKLPTTGEASILYILTICQMGFAEAYQKAINDFYLKVIHGTLTQEDIEGLVVDWKCQIFSDFGSNGKNYPNITQIKVSSDGLRLSKFSRLSNIKKVEITDIANVTRVGTNSFYNCSTLEELKCSPTQLEQGCFYMCENLIIGPDYLNLNNCGTFGDYCLYYVPCSIINFSNDINSTYFIGSYAFKGCGLEEVYLPDIPPELSNVNAFDNESPNLKFYVTSQNVLDTYSNATNWSNLISKFEVITS